MTSEVDAVSGSTFTSKSVFAALQAALKNASGESTDADTDTGASTDNTTVEGDSYTATAFGFGGDVTVTVVLNGSDIVDVKVVGDKETSGIGTNAIDQLPAAIVAADSADVDVVSGATITSTAILEAVQEILDQAQ